MALKLKRLRPVQKIEPIALDGKIADKADGLETSTLKIFDIPIAMLVDHEDNPNQQSEQVFDETVERIRREGFDEPIIVIPEIIAGKVTGKYVITSGHHRKKAGQLAGMLKIPAVIRQGWSADRAKIELVARNALRGHMDPVKFTKNFNELSAKYGEDTLRRMMGLTQEKQFKQFYEGVKKQLSPKHQRKLDEAKEEIKSVEDLSQVLNQIFREHGTKLDKSMLVFSFGGKKHIYVQVDKPTMAKVEALVKATEDENTALGDAFTKILCDIDITKLAKSLNKLDA